MVWKENTTYVVGEVVSRGGALYRCTRNHFASYGMFPETNNRLWTRVPLKSRSVDLTRGPVTITVQEQNHIMEAVTTAHIDVNPTVLECKVCWRGLLERSPHVVEPCGHTFCKQCVRKLGTTTKTCPFCRSRMKKSRRVYLL